MELNNTYSNLGHPFVVESLIQTSERGYALVGWSSINVTSGSGTDWIVKTDATGNKQWEKTYNGSFVNAIVEADDGGYVMTGWGMTSDLNGSLIKTDLNGNIRWNKTYGIANSLAKTEDGGYLLAGNDQRIAWMVKTDSNGDPQWSNNYAIGGGGNFILSAAPTSDGGYVAAGLTLLTDDLSAWVVKTNSSGNIEWNGIYESDISKNNIAGSIIETNDRGYVFTGSKDGESDEFGNVWLVKISSLSSSDQNQLNIISASEIFLVVIVTSIILISVAVIILLKQKRKRNSRKNKRNSRT